MLNQQIVAFRSVETDIQPFTAEPDTQTTLLHQVENAPELPYGHRFAMPQRGSCQAANQTGSDRTPLPIQSVVIRGYPWCQTHPRPSIHTNSRPLPCLPWFNSIPVPSVFRGVHPWFQIQPPNHTRTGSGGTSPSPKKHPRPSIRTNSRLLPCVPCPPSFKKHQTARDSAQMETCRPIPFALPWLAAREGPPGEGNSRMRQKSTDFPTAGGGGG